MVLEVQPCQGFSEQQLQLVKAVIVGNTLGAQVLLPTTSNNDLWQLLDTQSLFQTANRSFRNSWCANPPGIVRRSWCGQIPVDSLTILSRSELNLRHSHRKISQSIIFSQSVEDTVSWLFKTMSKYAAAKKGSDMGYQYPMDSSQFNVLDLRAQPDWEQFCKFGYVAAGLFILVVSHVFLC